MDPKKLYEELAVYKAYEEKRNANTEEQMVMKALQQAIIETVQRIASTIINERRQEIEDACNFDNLRDVLAAELARQFMASRMLGQPTPLDKPNIYAGQPRVSQGGLQLASNQAPYASQMVTAFGNAKGKP